MTNDENARTGHWQRFIVDVLVGTSTIAVTFAIGATTDVRYLLLIAGASVLVTIALMLEPKSAGQTARDPARSTQRRDGFDAVIADATSV